MKQILILALLFSLAGCSSPKLDNQIKKDQILAACSANDGSTLTISKDKNRYTVSGIVNYKKSPGDTEEKKTIRYVIPKDSKFFYNSDPLYLNDNNKKECTTFGFAFINDSSGQLKKCNQEKSKLEWVGKYRSNKAGKRTRKNDSKVAQILKNIEQYCSPYYRKLTHITYWHSNKPNKHCSIDGIELYEMEKPTILSNQSPIKGIFSTNCQFNQKMLDDLVTKNSLEEL